MPGGSPWDRPPIVRNFTPDTPTVSSLLPPRVRQWVYAILSALNGGYVVAEAAYDVPVPVLVVVGIINAAGFSLARSKVT